MPAGPPPDHLGTPPERLARAAEMLRNSRVAIAFTGAGISTDSGIPDFRSPSGVWATQRPVYYQDFLASPLARFELWRQKSLAFQEFRMATPNSGHCLLARWQASGRIARVVTQNIDGLHATAGSERPVELHGNAREVVCLPCGRRQEAEPWADRFRQTQSVPSCPECGGLLKWAVVLFGEPLHPQVWGEAERLARNCDLMLALGSSLVVEPAAGLPRLASQLGARLVIVNDEPTPLDEMADLVIRGRISPTLEAIDQQLRA